MENVQIRRTKHSRLNEADIQQPEFGSQVSDHMFSCEYRDGAWQERIIMPFQDLSLSPVTLALHYGQSIFEGMKAFRMADGRVNIFRIEKHYARLERSLERMCMPVIPFELFNTALLELVRVDRDWVPKADGSALYLRPLVFASEARFGVKVSEQYRFLIISGPVGSFFQKPVRVKIEKDYIRSAPGGVGYAKCAGNYGGAFYPTQIARTEGFDQVIWTDARTHRYVEESGMMNLMFVIDGALVTPPLSDSILDGITRDSLLQIARDMGVRTEERPVAVDEIVETIANGRMTEAFGAGTAAVVAPIGAIGVDGVLHQLPAYGNDTLMLQLRQRLNDIRQGRAEDIHGWNCII